MGLFRHDKTRWRLQTTKNQIMKNNLILTIIGVSLSCQKRKGGMGLSLGIGLALSFSYILFETISSTFAINAGWPPLLSAWIPNVIFSFIALALYRKAPK